jgi:hypothetical protein
MTRYQILALALALLSFNAIASAAEICGQEVRINVGDPVFTGYWERQDGSRLCAGLVVTGGEEEAIEAEYFAGPKCHKHLKGACEDIGDGVCRYKDDEGSVFVFYGSSNAMFHGRSGTMMGHFKKIEAKPAHDWVVYSYGAHKCEKPTAGMTTPLLFEQFARKHGIFRKLTVERDDNGEILAVAIDIKWPEWDHETHMVYFPSMGTCEALKGSIDNASPAELN